MDNTLYIQYAPSINWDYGTGRLPSGHEPQWTWEESYIPIEHKLGSKTLGKHEYWRVKVGIKGVWSNPIPLQGLGIKSVSTALKSTENGISNYALVVTYSDGSIQESSTYLVVKDGKDGKDGQDAINYDSASEWFDTEVELKAFEGFVDNQYYGIFDTKSIYKYNASATSGIKPDSVTGSGRYVFQYDLNSDFADNTDMEADPMVVSVKAVSPSTLQYWWDIKSADYYLSSEVDTLLGGKVDKVVGKGLSENDYTTADKTRLANTSGTNTGDQDLSGYLLKSLTQGKTWVGDGSNLPSEVFPDALNGYVTVGTGGQYTTIKAAVDAGKTVFLQVGNITEAVTFTMPTFFRFTGNRSYTLSITTSITVQANSNISFYDTVISYTNSSNLFNNAVSGVVFMFKNCQITFNYKMFNGNYDLTFRDCKIIGQPTVQYSSLNTYQCNYYNCYYDTSFGNGQQLIINHADNLTVSNNINYAIVYKTFTNSIIPITSIVTRFEDNAEIKNSTVGIYSENVRTIHATNSTLYFLNNSTYDVKAKMRAIGCTIANTSYGFRSGSVFDSCTFSTSTTLNAEVGYTKGITLLNCETNGLILPGNKSSVIGGQHTTITVNGNNNTVKGVSQATSIALGAVTGCIVEGNQVDTEITIVSGNNITNNSVY